jgi:hypothetical protein
VVDGNAAQPLDAVFATGTNTNQHLYESNSMQFVAGPKLAGAHIVKIQYRTDTENAPDLLFQVDQRTLTVMRSRV